MEAKNTITDTKQTFNFRRLFMVIMLVFVTAADILTDYVRAGFNAAIFADAAYWIKLALSCLSVVTVALTARDYFREREILTNGAVSEAQKHIDEAHASILSKNLSTRFDDYVAAINAERKREAYLDYLQFKLLKSRTKWGKNKWKTLLETAEQDIEYIPTKGNTIKLSWRYHIHFNLIRIATVFSRVERTDGDDQDLETNEGRAVGFLLTKKLLPLLAFAFTTGMLFYEPGDFAVATLINTFSKIFRIATSIYVGAGDGQTFVRGTLLSKMRLRLCFVQKFIEAEKNKVEPIRALPAPSAQAPAEIPTQDTTIKEADAADAPGEVKATE